MFERRAQVRTCFAHSAFSLPECSEVNSMQRFVAELSTPIEEADFERSWRSDRALNDKHPKVIFTFSGRRVSALIDSDSPERWDSSNFYRVFSDAIRRVDHACNVRWPKAERTMVRFADLSQIGLITDFRVLSTCPECP